MKKTTISILTTPQKSNVDTKKLPCLNGVTFSKPSFWVAMLVFGGSMYFPNLEGI